MGIMRQIIGYSETGNVLQAVSGANSPKAVIFSQEKIILRMLPERSQKNFLMQYQSDVWEPAMRPIRYMRMVFLLCVTRAYQQWRG